MTNGDPEYTYCPARERHPESPIWPGGAGYNYWLWPNTQYRSWRVCVRSWPITHRQPCLQGSVRALLHSCVSWASANGAQEAGTFRYWCRINHGSSYKLVWKVRLRDSLRHFLMLRCVLKRCKLSNFAVLNCVISRIVSLMNTGD